MKRTIYKRSGLDQHARAMNRPARKLKNLEDKIATKQGRPQKRGGAKLKRWKKAVAAYKPLTEQSE